MSENKSPIKNDPRISSRVVPRAEAIQVLTSVLSDQHHLDDALDLLAKTFSAEDRAWLQDVTAGVLRLKGRLDFIIDQNSLKKKPSGWLRKILLIAVYQLLDQDRVSATSVVYETVEMVKRMEGEAPAKFANALLRKVSAHIDEWKKLPIDEATSSLPHWMWKRLTKSYPKEKVLAFAQASWNRPKTFLALKSGETLALENPAELKSHPAFLSGDAIVQDLSSQTLVKEISNLLPKGAEVLDLCAAPGGKSIGLAWRGYKLTSTDRDEGRLKLLHSNAERTHTKLEIALADSVLITKRSFDAVWIDAPCTGTGTLRKNPEIRWLKTEKDLDKLVEIQKDLLINGVKHLKPEGILVYSVCSVLREEGEVLIDQFRKTLPADMKLEWVKTFSLWPQDPPEGDGFWACIYRRK